MPAQRRYLSDFLRRLRVEQAKPFTWLIGAGVSATSGIPLARDVSMRIVLFEYLISDDYIKSMQPLRPWDLDSNSHIRYSSEDLTDFFDWYEEVSETVDSAFRDLKNEALTWLKKQNGFQNVTPENPECYQKLFEVFFQRSSTSHLFLTSLVHRGKGVNLAHFGLAGLLKDLKGTWGHTVFTTNFDDLLLKALFGLNHTARVFGDLNSKDRPSVSPDYPQIVHLHGRHTSYYLLNTSDELSFFSSDMQESFRKHIADSDLLVLGYSGWDDLVMNTLKLWPNDPNLIQGNLIWVPYKSEDTILPETREFLDSCPHGRVQIIVKEEGDLDADSFIISMCNALSHKGFKAYRRGVMNYASTQHDFLLNQLEKYPEFDPQRALSLIDDARNLLRKEDIGGAEQKMNLAKRVVDTDDLPDELHAKAFLEIGILEMLLGKLDDANEQLSEALTTWDKLKSENPEGRFEKARALQALAQLFFQKGDMEQAKIHAKMAQARFTRPHAASEMKSFENTPEYGHNTKLFADIVLREGNIQRALGLLEKSREIFRASSCLYGTTICERSIGDVNRLLGKFSDAEKQYEKALEGFSKLGNDLAIASAKKGLGDLRLKQFRLEDARRYYREAKDIFLKHQHMLGEANIENAFGDYYFQKDEYREAANFYERSATLYKQANAQHGYANSLADLSRCYKRLENEPLLEDTTNRLKELNVAKDSAYVSATLESTKRVTLPDG